MSLQKWSFPERDQWWQRLSWNLDQWQLSSGFAVCMDFLGGGGDGLGGDGFPVKSMHVQSDSTSSIGRIVCTICKERPYGPKACIRCGNIICTTCSNNLMSPICPICRKELKLVRLIL